jgi:hypothetical protein
MEITADLMEWESLAQSSRLLLLALLLALLPLAFVLSCSSCKRPAAGQALAAVQTPPLYLPFFWLVRF